MGSNKLVCPQMPNSSNKRHFKACPCGKIGEVRYEADSTDMVDEEPALLIAAQAVQMLQLYAQPMGAEKGSIDSHLILGLG